ncbi:cilia- and flagella-associated protein 47-like isoform X2 [Physella acuta]|uniref:cilia- and flagella-associated protein 47-like isoform X2 n=1 Tax=Physella acuta TaxID=109671 RepID=UPI0027DB6D99|nr:cilia- and flagella-associated protein 47-like isoform X2 [Physella acuta]
MEGDVLGVRIIPPVVQFFNTKPYTRFEIPITVRNVSTSSKNIRYYGPKSEFFMLKVKNPEEPVAPGLSVSGVVVYESAVDCENSDKIVITVDGNVIEVPLFAYPTQPMLDIEDEVDFGTLVANCKVVSKDITLINKGSKSGDFEFTYEGNNPLLFIPMSGSVPPNSEMRVKVEYVMKTPGKFKETVDVALEGRSKTKVTIKGYITERTLELLSIKEDGTRVDCIHFGNTYYGTEQTQCAVLYNNGPEPISFVAVLNENALAEESGVDLTQSTTLALAKEANDTKNTGHTNDIISLVTAIPNQGILKPYQKVPIYFKFSPRWYPSSQGWKNFMCPPPRKDFALYMKIMIIGASEGFIKNDEFSPSEKDSQLEIAMTGTALPVLLNIYPTAKLDFGECPINEHADILCTVKNESKILPVLFEFKRVAHFTSHPPNGKISPGQTQDVIFSFAPKQAGHFKPTMLLEVIGQVGETNNPHFYHSEVIYSLPIKLTGFSNVVRQVPKPRFNTGITPYITNEVGLNIETTFSDLKEQDLRIAVGGSTRTKLHRLKNRAIKSADCDDKIKVAFPNDRAQSIRSFDRNERYKTLFTGVERYNYIDPDYAFDDMEIEIKKKKELMFLKDINKLQRKQEIRKMKREFLETNNNMDIGIKNGAGIYPKKLTLEDIKSDPLPPVQPNAEWKLLSTKTLAELEKEAVSKPVCEGLNAIPITEQEKKDCNRWLTPQQLHHVVIGPPTIDFGVICLRSVCQKELNIINNLDTYIHLVAEIDCRELRQSSPLSQVVPPHSKAVIPIIFESNTRGKFQRSVLYTVNGFFKHHVTVTAEVVPVALELSTNKLVLKPHQGMPAEAGYRSVITLYNKLNFPAEFTWSPDLGEKGTAFSIRPSTGVVEPGCDLDCEVVWHPSYLAPEDGSFTLLVNGGESRSLSCKAELCFSNVNFLDQRVSFGSAPVNLTSVGIGILHNSGTNHAYFQVTDPNPLPGLTISPVHGVVPVGGNAEIRVSLTPDSIIKFDTRIQVSIKGGKTLELRIGGSVEAPSVKINAESFNFGGVYCGSSASMTFSLTNKGNIKCKIEIDLTKYKDFAISFPGYQSQEDYNFQALNPGMVSVSLEPMEEIEGELTFTPVQVAAYDFVLPMVINRLSGTNPSPAPFTTPAPSSRAQSGGCASSSMHIINPKPVTPTSDIPRKHVIATALRQPLQLSAKKIEFLLPLNFHDISTNIAMGSTKAVVVANVSNEALTWGFDLSQQNKHLENGTFKFLHEKGLPFIALTESRGIEGTLEPGQSKTILINFCPESAGQYQVTIPVVINSNWSKPFQFIEIYGELKSPKMWFNPPKLFFTPVPLATEVSIDFTILASNYRRKNKIIVTFPDILADDKTPITPLKVDFPQGNEIMPCNGSEAQVDPCAIPCKLTFSSPRPVSFCQEVLFSDQDGLVETIQVTATADNCLLTCYPFIALHRSDHQIVCEQGTYPKGRKMLGKKKSELSSSVSSGEAHIVPCLSPTHSSRPSTSATSSTFQISTSSYESSSTASGSLTPAHREGALNKITFNSELGLEMSLDRAMSAMCPDESTEEGLFHAEVLQAAQRWFASQGWPGGPYPILIPETLRISISKKTAAENSKSKEDLQSKTNIKGNKKQKAKTGFNKVSKTIYDMIGFLSGRPMPGIPINSPLPADPVERVRQIYWQHCTLLTFLRCQGACVAAIQPEYLMPPADFLLWRQLQKSIKFELLRQGNTKDAAKIRADDDIEEEMFEAISKRTWTDVLLQILKILVLSKVTQKTLKALTTPYKEVSIPLVNPDPLASNIYSVPERILLAWMNHYYETNRAYIWQSCPKGGIPPSRWIVNFDYDLMDGLVIGALLGAHMPFLIKSHLEGMYTHPETAEQCLHNALKVINAMKFAYIDFDVQAIDITDPNPIALLLLVVSLYQRLPQYSPKTTIEFVGGLHSVVTRQVKVTNTSVKSLIYNVIIVGNDAKDFSVQKGNLIVVPSKSTLSVNVEFRSRFLRHAEAYLLLVGRRHGTATGNTLSFKLVTEIDYIKPKSCLKTESPCYELKKLLMDVVNPFQESGDFKIVLIESNTILSDLREINSRYKEKKLKAGSKSASTKKFSEPVNDLIPMNKILEHQEAKGQKNSQIPKLQAFYTPMASVHFEALGSSDVEIHYLPFSVQEHQCSIIFMNESIGEFVYSIEATALQPLPSYLPYVPSKESARISSAAAAGNGRGMFGGDDSIIYWKCDAGVTLKETLHIPVSNISKERALIQASQQSMSDLEMQRRQVAGTLMSCSMTSKTIKNLSNNPVAAISIAKAIGPVADVYRVEIDSEYFKVPDLLVMPSSQSSRSKCLPKESGGDGNEDFAGLTVEFKAKEPGHYPATITLRAIDDIRVYKIECIVNQEGSTAELEFNAPLHQTVTQNIPVVNQTSDDWELNAEIFGDCFSGPPILKAKAFEITDYPLTFKPMKEEEIIGKLLLKNQENNTEQAYTLIGIGLRPLALDNIKLICGAKASITHSVTVPNVTKKKLVYRVESDLSFISGDPTITVLPNQTGLYRFTVTPTKRGSVKGVLAFIAKDSSSTEIDSDGEEYQKDEDATDYVGYRMWYALEIDIKPALPEKVMTVVCPCQKKFAVEVIVRNPTPKELSFGVTIKGSDLSGPLSITLPPGEKDVYTLTYSPSAVGETRGSLIFFNKSVGEFWYDLILKAEPPVPTTLPHMECELGKWTYQTITLKNPTNEVLELTPVITNTNNYTLEREVDKAIIIKGKGKTEVTLRFMPTSLGDTEHLGKIIFRSDRYGDWVFIASGTGLLPRPHPPINAISAVFSNTTIIIPFRNPTDVPILADILFTDSDVSTEKTLERIQKPSSAFKLLLKHTSNIHVGAKSTLEIPVYFAPTELVNYKGFCTVVVRREDGQQWPYVPQDSYGHKLSTESTGLNKIRWLYPIVGIAESSQNKDSHSAQIMSQARDQVEQRLEVTLSGVSPGSTSGPVLTLRAKTPKDKKPQIPSGVVVGNTMATAEEFSYELIYPNKEARDALTGAVKLEFTRHYRDPSTGLVVLIFNMRFLPTRIMDYQVELHIKAATGGLWRFPLRFTATDPPVDDNILIKATGLSKLSSVGFRLTSQQKNPAPFRAYFENGSDPEFTVHPESGELMPVNTGGTLLVIDFLPQLYGKLYHAKLIVQTEDMQWSYNIKGDLPEYHPPRGISAPPIAGPHAVIKKQRAKKNYIRENLKLIATAVSSPIKGASLIKADYAHMAQHKSMEVDT